ncbi:MAG: thioredoxin family protein [Nanoarchaeota archaeon]|nr:thioredoxin family protein [Nanoarchaeota archaeon]
MNLKIFTQDNCPNCPPAKEIGKQLEDEGFKISYHDIRSLEGLSEATFHDVMATPSMVIVDDDDKEVHSWRSDVPSLDEVKAKLAD